MALWYYNVSLFYYYIVTAPLKVSINPPRQIVDSDKAVSLECVIIGVPIEEITWYKDGSVISNQSGNDGVVIHAGRTTLTVSNMDWRHEGIYQCFVTNNWQVVQSSAQVLLGGGSFNYISCMISQDRFSYHFLLLTFL